MLTYEQQLDRDFNWALLEGSKHFECCNAVHHTMRQLVARLEMLGIEYAVTGDLCMFFHGYRRFTQIVEVLTTKQGLAQIHQKLMGQGYYPDEASPNGVRDSETGVRIKFLVAGQSLSSEMDAQFVVPHLEDVSIALRDVQFVNVASIIEMKLVRGRVSYRLGELCDVQELIRYLELPREFSAKLKPIFRQSFDRLWNYAQTAKLDDY